MTEPLQDLDNLIQESLEQVSRPNILSKIEERGWDKDHNYINRFVIRQPTGDYYIEMNGQVLELKKTGEVDGFEINSRSDIAPWFKESKPSSGSSVKITGVRADRDISINAQGGESAITDIVANGGTILQVDISTKLKIQRNGDDFSFKLF